MSVSKSNYTNGVFNFEHPDISISTHSVDILLLVLLSVFMLQFYILPFFSISVLNSIDLYTYNGGLDIGLIYSYLTHSSIDHFVINIKWLIAYRVLFTWKESFKLHSLFEVVSFTVVVGILTNLLAFILTLFVIGSFNPVIGFSGVLFGLFGFQTASAFKRNHDPEFTVFHYIMLSVAISVVWLPLYYMVSSGAYDLSLVGHGIGFVVGFVYFYIR